MQEHNVGGLVLVYEPAPPPEPISIPELLDDAKDAMREARAPMLNAVVGILAIAVVEGDVSTQQKAVEVRQALLDITNDAALNASTTWEEMEVATKLAYRRVAALVAKDSQFAAVFREVTGA